MDEQRLINILEDCLGYDQAVRHANKAFKNILAAATIEEAQAIASAAITLMDHAIPDIEADADV